MRFSVKNAAVAPAGAAFRESGHMRAGTMALTMERRVGIKLGAWTTVKTALALGLWLVLSQVLGSGPAE
jgi:hypothetical protein